MPLDRPIIVVLAGPNGAGKTTAARTVLADTLELTTFVNADVIAAGLSGFDPGSMAMDAGRIMLQRLYSLANQRTSFAFETTLAGRTYARLLRSVRDTGYLVDLIYFWLKSPDLAVARVADRVRQGGHDIPEATVRSRYIRSVRNFFELFRPMVNTWRIFDNSFAGTPSLVAYCDDEGREVVLIETVWREMKSEAGR